MSARGRTVTEVPGCRIALDDWIESLGPIGPGEGADLIAGALIADSIEDGRSSSAYVQLGCRGSKPSLHPSCGRRALRIIRLVLREMRPHGQLIDGQGLSRGAISVRAEMPDSATLRALWRQRADRGRIARTAAFLKSRRRLADARALTALAGESP